MAVFIPCNLCEEDSYSLVFKKDGYNIVKCNKCGLLYINPRPSTEHTTSLYQDIDYFNKQLDGIGYRDYIADKKLHISTFIREFNFIEKIKKRGKLLDIGCAAGFSLLVAKERGWNACGVEVSKFASQYAKDQFELEVFHGTLEEAGYAKSCFDIIISYGTIEHVLNPLAFMKEAEKVLKEDGIFVIATPDIGTWLGNRNFQYKPLEHFYYFDRNTITSMLNKAGMEVIDIRKMKINRSVRFIIERLKYYFKGIGPLLKMLESFAERTKLSEYSFFIPDGQMVVSARKKKS